MSAPDRRAMVERPGKELSVRRQCALVGVARSGVYRSKPVTGADDLAVMRPSHTGSPAHAARRRAAAGGRRRRAPRRRGRRSRTGRPAFTPAPCPSRGQLLPQRRRYVFCTWAGIDVELLGRVRRGSRGCTRARGARRSARPRPPGGARGRSSSFADVEQVDAERLADLAEAAPR